jgi:multiple sugar transport system substrate-binding protein
MLKLFRAIARPSLLALFALFIISLFVACHSNSQSITPASTSDSQLRIWWSQGFLPLENEAIQKIVSDWQNKSGSKAELTLFTNDVLMKEVKIALEAGKPPDLLFARTIDYTLLPRLAWDNKLADVSDVLEPVKNTYIPNALAAASYQNNITQKRSYYAVPIAQQTAHIHYWQNSLEMAGFNSSNIPQDWDTFWQFWQKVQLVLRQQGQKDISGVGLTLSPTASDTFFEFEYFLAAYNAKLIDENGRLLLDDPKVRQGIIAALKDFTRPYKDGYNAPEAAEWTDTDNNIAFLNSEVVMVVNPSLSVPVTQREDPDVYRDRIVTPKWPKKPDGTEIRDLSAVKQIALFESSQYKKEAKNFLSYLIQPQILDAYLQSSGSSFFPVMQQLLDEPFWQGTNPKDPHIAAAAKQLQQTRQFYTVFNPAYGEVQSQNLWGKALKSIVKEGLSPEQAADRAIKEIEEIFANWK